MKDEGNIACLNKIKDEEKQNVQFEFWGFQ
jgi:hypothetical protein